MIRTVKHGNRFSGVVTVIFSLEVYEDGCSHPSGMTGVWLILFGAEE